MLLRKLGEIGVEVSQGPEGLRASARAAGCTVVDVATLPYPGVATDYKPFLVTMLSVADGVGIVTENLFSGRFRYVDELRRMGADIRTEGHHAVVRGVRRLSGAPVRAPTSGPAPPWSWPGWRPRARPSSPTPSTSTAATRTSRPRSAPWARTSPAPDPGRPRLRSVPP